MPVPPVAALDCGTNSTRLLIVDSEGNALVREMRITRLGQGVDATHALRPEAIERTLEVLRTFRGLMDEANVEQARLVATSAVRDASNGEAFLQAATAAVGIEAELLSGFDEGRLSHAGATRGLPPGIGDDVVVDIGGGSTELIVARNGVIHAVSMDLGCVRLSERSLLHDPPQASEIADVNAVVATALHAAYGVVPELATLPPGSRLIGLAGTVSTLTALELGLIEYDRAKVHHATLTLAAVEKWCEDLAAESAQSRGTRAGMVDGRQDVIVGGALILRQVMERLGMDECLVSESDILDGLVMSLQGDA